MNIIVSAYGCEANKGSESGVGWFWVKGIAKYYKVWLVTRSNNEKNITQFISDDMKGNFHVIYYDLPDFIKRFKKREKGFYSYYTLWQIGIIKVVRQLIEEVNPDYIMHLTFGNLWLPTYIHKLGCPFIWGPIGGGEIIPDPYLKSLGVKARATAYLRKFLIWTKEFNIFLQSRCKQAELIITRTEDTQNIIPKRYRSKAVVMLETAISDELLETFSYNRKINYGKKFIIVFTGRLIPVKGIDIIIEALARSRNKSNIELRIIGKGTLKDSLAEMAGRLGIENQVEFIGELERKDVLEELKQADAFAFPSYKEGGTWALMEAMAAMLPCICIDTSGMHVITDSESAIRIIISGKDETINKFSEAIDYLYENRETAYNIGLAGRRRMEQEFTWTSKEIFINEQFEKLNKKDR